MKLVILGPPGSGKGTQAKLLVKKFKLKYISGSALISEEIKKRVKHADLFKKDMAAGLLIPDRFMDYLIKKHLPKDNYLSDGYPRRTKEANFLDKLNKPDIVIFLDVPMNITKARMIKRAKIENRIDDTPKIITRRIKIYKKETMPVINHYKKLGLLMNINGIGSINKINKEIIEVLLLWP